MAATHVSLRPLQRVGQLSLLVVGLVGLVPGLGQPLDASIGYAAAGLVFAGVGWLLTQRLPTNGIGWCFLGVWSLIGAFGIADWAQQRATQTGQYTAWWAWAGGWLVGWMWGPLLLLATTLPLLLFPGGFASRRWRRVAAVGVVAATISVVAEMVSPQLGYFANHDQQVPILVSNNPLSPAFLADAGPADGWRIRNLCLLVLCVTAVIAAVGLVLRARRSSGDERLQFRWVTYGAVLMAGLIMLTFLPGFADSGLLGTTTWSVALAALPVTTGIAILRFHLYDIDRVISRTTAYAVVTGLLIGTYAVVVTAVSRLLPDSSNLSIAAATLTAAAIARPLLRRVQGIVDRRFNRARYDAQHTVEGFGEHLRQQVHPEVVEAELLRAVSDTLHPTAVTVWLREER